MSNTSIFPTKETFVRSIQNLGLTNSRNMYWYRKGQYNFGDWIGPYLFRKFTGKSPLFAAARKGGFSKTYYTAGSILELIRCKDRATVWGSGSLGNRDTFARPEKVLAVRGPRSRDMLHKFGYPTSEVFGDPALLLPLVFTPDFTKKTRVGIVPHISEFDQIKTEFANADDITVLDLRNPVETTISQLAACETLVSSSLHGVIVAQAYGIPCCWVQPRQPLHGDGRKFFDYFEAGGIFNANSETLAPTAKAPQLAAMARNAPVAQNAPLLAPLLAACPFKGKAQIPVQSTVSPGIAPKLSIEQHP